MDRICRVKLVDSFDGLDGELVESGGNRLLFSTESRNLEETPGVLLLCFGRWSQLGSRRMSYQEGWLWMDAYGEGYGSRSTAKSFTTNCCIDERISKRPHPGPFTATEEVGRHQYHNNSRKLPLLRSMLEKELRCLTNTVKQLAPIVNPQFMKVIGGSCTKEIATCGAAATSWEVIEEEIRRTGKSNQKRSAVSMYAYGFCNTPHRDTCDLLRGKARKEIEKELTSEYGKRLTNLPDFGMPTTCGYQILWNPKSCGEYSSMIEQFFCMDGLSLAIPIVDCRYIHFLGSMFVHNTSVAVRTDGRRLSIGDADPDVVVFAWGTSGGQENFKRRNKTQAGRTRKRRRNS